MLSIKKKKRKPHKDVLFFPLTSIFHWFFSGAKSCHHPSLGALESPLETKSTRFWALRTATPISYLPQGVKWKHQSRKKQQNWPQRGDGDGQESWLSYHVSQGQRCTCVLVAQSCPTLAIPWAVARQAPLSMRFSRQEYWGGLPFPTPGKGKGKIKQKHSQEKQQSAFGWSKKKKKLMY